MSKVLPYEERKAWIVDWIKKGSKPFKFWITVDTLDQAFVDAYCEHTKATPTYMLIGSNKCELLRADLHRMYREGVASRRVAGVSGMAGMGFPRHIPSYSLKEPKT